MELLMDISAQAKLYTEWQQTTAVTLMILLNTDAVIAYSDQLLFLALSELELYYDDCMCAVMLIFLLRVCIIFWDIISSL